MTMRKSKQLIPKGYYCYDERGICPYWHCDEARPAQQNGYCAYMGKGDWDLNKEKGWREEGSDEWKSAEEIGMPLSLLWDKVKMCGVNEPHVPGR